LKGAGAYVHHAYILGKEDDDLYAGFHQMLDCLASDPVDVEELTEKAMETGALNLKVMELLDSANTGAYGNPEPTQVRVTPVKGKCIVVSGHDLKDLAMLLEQARGTDINIYTHGEMLPAHGYPELRKFDHLVGNYGTAWQNQRKEFDDFSGPILVTTNCIMIPKESYRDRLYTCGIAGAAGVQHLKDRDFSAVIEKALSQPPLTDSSAGTLNTGFHYTAVLGLADKIIEAVKAGKIRHFFFIGGCDGAKPGRNYFSEFAEKVPDDCVILTAACGKYRLNAKDYGDIDGIPRLLDTGQCNDCYSVVKIAMALADAFDCGVNDLPLSLIVSWYEQKAVAILLTLLHLGIKNIRLGPSLPAFVTPNVLNVLVENYAIKPIGTADEDLAEILS